LKEIHCLITAYTGQMFSLKALKTIFSLEGLNVNTKHSNLSVPYGHFPLCLMKLRHLQRSNVDWMWINNCRNKVELVLKRQVSHGNSVVLTVCQLVWKCHGNASSRI